LIDKGQRAASHCGESDPEHRQTQVRALLTLCACFRLLRDLLPACKGMLLTSKTKKIKNFSDSLDSILTLLGIFFASLRGKWPQKWSPGQFSLLGDWLVNYLQILLQKNEKRFNGNIKMSKKCPYLSKNVHKQTQETIFEVIFPARVKIRKNKINF